MDTNGMTVIEQRTMEAIQHIAHDTPELGVLKVRDLFAMAAMPTFLNQVLENTEPDCSVDLKSVAEASYQMADYMMEVRK